MIPPDSYQMHTWQCCFSYWLHEQYLGFGSWIEPTFHQLQLNTPFWSNPGDNGQMTPKISSRNMTFTRRCYWTVGCSNLVPTRTPPDQGLLTTDKRMQLTSTDKWPRALQQPMMYYNLVSGIFKLIVHHPCQVNNSIRISDSLHKCAVLEP